MISNTGFPIIGCMHREENQPVVAAEKQTSAVVCKSQAHASLQKQSPIILYCYVCGPWSESSSLA